MIDFNDFFYGNPWSEEIEKVLQTEEVEQRINEFMEMMSYFSMIGLEVQVDLETEHAEVVLKVHPISEEHEDLYAYWTIVNWFSIDPTLYQDELDSYGDRFKLLPFEIKKSLTYNEETDEHEEDGGIKLYFDGVGHKFGVLEHYQQTEEKGD
jgi:hypothetical protein